MDKNKLNISAIETFFNELLDEKVSSNTYFTTLPTAFNTKPNDMVLVDCSNIIHDLDAFGRGTVMIWLYAKPMSSGKKNVTLLSKMEKSLNEAIAANTNGHYVVTRLGEFADYDSDAQMHCNIVQLQLLIA